MKLNLKRFFGSGTPAETPLTPQLAVAQLLLEVARADLNSDGAEIATIRRYLAAAYGLGRAELDELMATASANVESSVSLYSTVQVVNRALNQDGKNELIRMLWQVAYADGRLDPHEEALLRRLSDLLYVSHDSFIREKLAVLQS